MSNNIDPSSSTIETTYSNSNKDIDSEFDTAALKECLEKEQLDKALSLILHSKTSSSLQSNTVVLDYPLKYRVIFFDKLSKLPPPQLATFLQPYIDYLQQEESKDSHYQYNLIPAGRKRLRSFLKTLGSTLPKDSIFYLLNQFSGYKSVQVIMLQQYINKYIKSEMDDQDQQLDTLLDYLKKVNTNNNNNNSNLDSTLKVQLFNMTLNGCIKTKKQDHITKILNQMEKSGTALDEVTYNILIRSQLDMNNGKVANELYDNMKKSSLTPTVATFNTFIRYACKHQNWNDLTAWLDQMEHHHKQPNPITLRIMMDALTNNTAEQQVVDNFKRVSDNIAITNQDLEWTINISITHLLRNNHIDTALAILQKLFETRPKMEAQSYSLSVYSYNLLIHAYTLNGDMNAAENVLLNMKNPRHHQQQPVNGNETHLTIPSPDIISYTTLIHGYIKSAPPQHINMKRVTTLYKELIERGLEENRSLQSVLLYGLIKSGFCDSKESMKLFKLLTRISSNKKRSTKLNQKIDNHIPRKSIQLLKEAMDKNLPFDTSTLNIWVRGLSLFNHDLNMAETMVYWMTKQYQISINERTVFYLVKAAIKQRRFDKAKKWINTYEKNGKTIQGSGLLYFKRHVMGE
ncbi:unnamed protein product [Cunninghamella echinulata]